MDISIPIQPASAHAELANFVGVQVGRPPILLLIGRRTPGPPGTPEHGIRGHSPDYRPAVAATSGTLDVQRQEALELTEQEWNNWPAGDAASDAAYLHALALNRLGYTAVE